MSIPFKLKLLNITVAVIGNGPLSIIDHNYIKSYSFSDIIHLNDAKNYRINDPVTFRAVRANGQGGYWGLDGSKPKYRMNQSLILIGDAKFKPNEKKVALKITVPLVLYSKCRYCIRNIKECNSSSAPWGPTTGAIVLDLLQKDTRVYKIHVFGMNFLRLGNSQHLKNEMFLFNSCCEKCILHNPYKNTYYR